MASGAAVDEVFDYVIAGGGAAGVVLASRLSEDPHVRVALVEAGGPIEGDLVRAPALYPLLAGTAFDWGYATEPQAGLDGRRIPYPRGRGLGGSASINALLWVRGHRSDWDGYRDAGCEGWGWDDVFPCFLRAEDREGREVRRHAEGGSVRIERPRAATPLERAFVEASARLGRVPAWADLNRPEQAGAGLHDLTQRGGERAGVVDGYLDPARRRSNLHVFDSTLVDRVLFEGRRARGLRVLARDGVRVLGAEREIALAAGSIGTAAILLRSGLGDPDALSALGIACKAPLRAVGRNLEDHLYSYASVRATHPSAARMHLGRASRSVPETIVRGSPYADNHVPAAAFVSLREARRPDLQLYFSAWPAPEPRPDGTNAYDEGLTATIMVCPLRPRSRGRVELASADPVAPPRIDPAYLAEPDDLRAHVEGLRLAHAILADEAFRGLVAERLVPSGTSDEAIEADVRRRATTVFHPVATCAMGAGEDSVVDPRLRVRGVDGLRVVDASVLPRMPGANTLAPTIVVAERGADLILRR